MTAKQFAQAIGRPYTTVALWLRQNRIPEAYLLEVGEVRVWQVPPEAVKTFTQPKPGRPKGKKAKKKAN